MWAVKAAGVTLQLWLYKAWWCWVTADQRRRNLSRTLRLVVETFPLCGVTPGGVEKISSDLLYCGFTVLLQSWCSTTVRSFNWQIKHPINIKNKRSDYLNTHPFLWWIEVKCSIIKMPNFNINVSVWCWMVAFIGTIGGSWSVCIRSLIINVHIWCRMMMTIGVWECLLVFDWQYRKVWELSMFYGILWWMFVNFF